MEVEVYRNLHKNCWSVRNHVTGIVINHVDNIHLENTTLVVRQGGRKRVLLNKRKNVHAFIKGTVSKCTKTTCPIVSPWIEEILYDPYKYASFVLKDTEETIPYAKHIYLTEKGKVFMGGE